MQIKCLESEKRCSVNKKLNAVILCGGRSSRMGQNKALLPFDEKNNKSILDFQYEKLSTIFNKVYVSSKYEDEYKNYETITDNNSIHSPMIALQSIFKYLKDDEVFIITVDTPLISEETILRLVNFYKENDFDIVVPKDSKETVHNLCGIFKRSILKKIENCLNEDIHKINYLINHTKHCMLGFNFSDEFLNINTKEDYQKALNMMGKKA